MSVGIRNRVMEIQCDPASGGFSVIRTASGQRFVRDGRLEGGGGSVSVQVAEDAVFGRGERIVIAQDGGGTVSLELYGDLPFTLVRGTLVNRGASGQDIPHVVPATFALDLETPAGGLRTLGTGGLLPPDENPGSYVFLACADPRTRAGVVAGWISQERGSGVMHSSVSAGQVSFEARIDYGHLRIPAGGSAPIETLALGFFDDVRLGLEQFADAVSRTYGIILRPRQAVYCTWYAEKHGQAGDEASTLELARFIHRELYDFGLRVIQIDDRWQDGPLLDGPPRGFERCNPEGPYPDGFGRVHETLRELGITLGLWWLPFGRNHTDAAWSDRQDWFARWADGEPMKTRSFGGTCLDLTHPAVREHLATLARRYREWGVDYYKMDGLWTGTATELAYINDGYVDDHMDNLAPLHDPSVTQVEMYRNGMRLIREAAGDDVFLSGCAVSQNMRSFGASFGLVDAMRIGPDFNHDGKGIQTGPIRASRLYFLNGRVWWNDPDPAKVRESGAASLAADPAAAGGVSLDVARLTTSFVALTGQFFLLSDWLPDLSPGRIEVLKRTMIPHDAEVRPVDYLDRDLPALWLLTDARDGDGAGGADAVTRHVLGLFNWEGDTLTLGETLEKTGLDPARGYHAFDFWNNTLLPDVRDCYAYEVPPESCRILALRAVEGRPVLLSTSRHLTQGGVDIVRERWGGAALEGVSRLIAGDPCELRIRVPEGWVHGEVSADTEATVMPSEPGLLRVSLAAPATRDTAWRVVFCQTTKTRRT